MYIYIYTCIERERINIGSVPHHSAPHCEERLAQEQCIPPTWGATPENGEKAAFKDKKERRREDKGREEKQREEFLNLDCVFCLSKDAVSFSTSGLKCTS